MCKQKEDKVGCTDDCSNTSDGQFGRCGQRPGASVSQKAENGPKKDGKSENRACFISEQKSHNMGYH